MTPEEKIKAFYDGKEFWMDGQWLHYTELQINDGIKMLVNREENFYCSVEHIRDGHVSCINHFCNQTISATFQITKTEFHSEYMEQLEKNNG